MSIIGKTLQIMDTCDCSFIANGVTLFSGATSQAELSQKTDKVEIFSGIGNNKVMSMNTKKNVTVKMVINEFNLDYIAMLNGVTLDKTSKLNYAIGVSIPVTTLSATVTGATRVLSVRKVDGTFLKTVVGAPASLNEVRVSGTTLTFYTGFAEASVLVTSVMTTTTKDVQTIVMGGSNFAYAGELLMNTVAYDQATEQIVANVITSCWKAKPISDFTIPFALGKPMELTVDMDILVPTNLPDGTINTNRELGRITVVEI